MHITQNFLISSYQEYRNIIRLFLLQAMNRHIVCHIPGRDKIGYFPIGITGYILQSGRTIRLLIQTLNGHNRKNLVDCPRIRQWLEKWKITEIFIGQQLGQSTEFIGGMFQPTGYLIDFASNWPIKTFDLSTRFQVHNSMTEQIKCFFTYLLGIMPRLEHLILVQRIPDTIKFLYQFVCIRSNLFFIIPLR